MCSSRKYPYSSTEGIGKSWGLVGGGGVGLKGPKIYSRADMCLNCSLSVKSMKFGMMIVFKALKKIGYGAIAKKSVKCEK